MHASSIKIVKVTPEAEFMLNDFWEKAKAKGKLSFRMYKGLFNIAEAMTKLHLKEIVDSKFAEQAIEAVRLMMVQYGETVKSTTNPRELTLNKCLEILREVKAGITVYSLFEMACKSDKVISEYIGRNWSMDSNHKVKNVVDLLRNHSNIKPVGVNPVILQWSDSAQSSSQPDQPDAPDAIIENNDNENTVKADTSKIKIASDRSNRSDSNPKTPELIPMGKTKLQPCYSEGSYPIRTENPLECPDCHRMIDPFDKNTHPACCKG